jgi:hypothetical protein
MVLPAALNRSMLYNLQANAAAGRYSPRQLLQLLLLLRHWRPAEQSAAAAARAGVVEACMGASQRQMYGQLVAMLQQQQQQQQQQTDLPEPEQQQQQQQMQGALDAQAAQAAAAQEYNGDVLSMTMLTLSRLRVQPSDTWMQLHSRLLLQLLPGMSATEVSRTLLGFARLGYTPEPAVTSQLMQRTQQLLPHMRSSHLVAVMHALGKLHIVPSESWLRVFYAAVQAAPDQLQVSGFGMVAWGLAKLGARPQQVWMEDLMQQAFGAAPNSSSSSDGLLAAGRLKPQHLANLLCAFAKLGFVPGVQWMSWFRAQLGQAGVLRELDHFHIEWAWRELHEQYRAAADAASSATNGHAASVGADVNMEDGAAADSATSTVPLRLVAADANGAAGALGAADTQADAAADLTA